MRISVPIERSGSVESSKIPARTGLVLAGIRNILVCSFKDHEASLGRGASSENNSSTAVSAHREAKLMARGRIARHSTPHF